MNVGTLIFLFILIPITFFGLIFSFFANLIDRTGDRFNKIAIWWSRLNIKLFGIVVDIYGRDNYNPDNNYLVVSNHAGMADIPILIGILNLNIRLIAKEDVGKIPLFGRVIKKAGFIMIKRGQNREALNSLLTATEVLKSGRSVHIFPEGTRSATGELLPFKRGAFIVAKKGLTPVLPVTIIGTHLITPKNSFKINKGKVKVIIDKPIEPSDLKNAEELMDITYKTIENSLNRYRYN